MGKKKLDNLFQERLRDFGEVPDEKVWNAIEASLDNKKRSRALPIWWKLGGVAAVLAIALLAINTFSDTLGGDGTITDIEQKDPKKQEVKSNDNKIIQPSESIIVATDNKGEDTYSTSDEDRSGNDDTSNSAAQSGNAQKVIGKSIQKTESKSISSALDEKKSGITSTQKQEVSNALAETDRRKKNDVGVTPKPEIADVQATQEKGIQEKVAGETMEQSKKAELTVNNKLEKGFENTEAAKKEDKNKELLAAPKQNNAADITETNGQLEETILPIDGKKSIFDEIKAQEEQETLAEGSKNRWSAGANFAPVYFDAFGKGSPVHSIFVPNSKSGETNLSYGVSIAYEINDRLSVRSGLQKVDYGYNTNDIEFSSSLEGSSQIDNIDYALTSRSLVLQSKAGVADSFVGPEPALMASDANAKNPARDGSMSQQFGYLELPVELNYALVDRKIGLHLIGGISSLFLVDNSVSLSAGNQKMEMGEANNVNSVNFSTNVGFGVDYNFSPRVKLNIEPIFKYQLNTFSGVDGTFQPFSVGIFSGLSFKL